ncbi:MAG: hypothetical protein E7575_03115 [Ruminococcaceae bacterium]|nr:hypothetical protein [Oscillospiraceae bacterium]
MYYRFSIDDNIRFLRDLSEKDHENIFSHPYLALFKRLHDKYGAKFQFNLFYSTEGFDLSQMTDRYKSQWQECASWLRFSFHSLTETGFAPYIDSDYQTVFDDASRVHREIIRFAGETSLSLFTTIHYCQCSQSALCALRGAGIRGLVGLFSDVPSCYGKEYPFLSSPYIYDSASDMYYFTNDIVLNLFSADDAIKKLSLSDNKKFIEAMIHEQYFYPDYYAYQPDFERKVEACIKHLASKGRKSIFLEELINDSIH